MSHSRTWFMRRPPELWRRFLFCATALLLGSASVPAPTDPAKDVVVRLSPSQAATPARPRVARPAPLDEAEVNALLAALPPLPQVEAKPFALKQSSRTPPKNTVTLRLDPTTHPVQQRSPPPKRPPVQALQVVRHTPEGPVKEASQVVVAFSQPMVSGYAPTLSEADVPISITPSLKGAWRFLGPDTLTLESRERFPMATRYTVEVRPGTRSVLGGVFDEPRHWTFETPPPTLVNSFPNGGPVVPLDTPIIFVFDQAIDPKGALSKIQVSTGGKTIRLRLLTDREFEGYRKERCDVGSELACRHLHLWSSVAADRLLLTRAVEPLPKESTVTVNIPVGIPSREGPIVSKVPTTYSFTTYGPLQFKELRCSGDRPSGCWNDGSLILEFNNQLDPRNQDELKPVTEPAISDLKVSVEYSRMSLRGNFVSGTKYRIIIPKNLRDAFGQSVSGDPALDVTFVDREPGPAKKWLLGESKMWVMDPAAQGRYWVGSVGYSTLRVRVFSVRPEDYARFREFCPRYREGKAPAFPGKKILDTRLQPKPQASPEDPSLAVLNLNNIFKERSGQALIVAEPEQSDEEDRVCSWVQHTDLGIDLTIDDDNAVAFVSSIKNGKPLSGATVTLLGESVSAKTDAFGMARLKFQLSKHQKAGALTAVAQLGRDLAFLPQRLPGSGHSHRGSRYDRGEEESEDDIEDGSETAASVDEALLWYVVDDRRMYQPGEEVHLKGFVRPSPKGDHGVLGAVGDAAKTISYSVSDVKPVLRGKSTVNMFGGFDLAFRVPEDFDKSHLTIVLEVQAGSARGARTTHGVSVREFRRPEFEVSANTASAGPFVVGESAEATLVARYYAGGGVSGAEVTWSATQYATTYAPPSYTDFSFGCPAEHKLSDAESFVSVTDNEGRAGVRLGFLPVKATPTPYLVTTSGLAKNLNRQVGETSTRFLVHPSAVYVGLRTSRGFFPANNVAEVEVEVVASDIDGRPVPNRLIEMEAVHLEWKKQKDGWEEQETDRQTCKVTSGATPVSCRVKTGKSGRYKLRATTQDSKGRSNCADSGFWIDDTRVQDTTAREERVGIESIDVVPSKTSYSPGDTADILLHVPFAPARGVLTIWREGMRDTIPLSLDAPTSVVKVPIQEWHIPNVYLEATVVGTQVRACPGDMSYPDESCTPNPNWPRRPAIARSDEVELSVSAMGHRLDLKVRPRESEVAPGGQTAIDVSLVDHRKQPVAGEVALWVVDEAVLALSGYFSHTDPLEAFFPSGGIGGWAAHSRTNIDLVDVDFVEIVIKALSSTSGAGILRSADLPDAAGAQKFSRLLSGGDIGSSGVGLGGRGRSGHLGGDGPNGGIPSVSTRTDFNPLAIFAAQVRTDSAGHATVPLQLKDSLTRYRILAVAASGDADFGSDESLITAKLPLAVRPSPPRFVRSNDLFEVPIIVVNDRAENASIAVVARGQNVKLPSAQGFRVDIPAHDQIEVRFPAIAMSPGRAVLQVAAVSDTVTDAAVVDWPVWSAATTETFAMYGEVDEGAVLQPLAAPGGAVAHFGGLSVQIAATALPALIDAALHLSSYPYECSEQIASRLLAVSSLRDVLTTLAPKDFPRKEAVDAAIRRDADELKARFDASTGVGLWQKGDGSWPFVSVHVLHALLRAGRLEWWGPQYLDTVTQQVSTVPDLRARAIIRSYALYVQALALGRKGAPNRAHTEAEKLVSELEVKNLPAEALGFLLPVLDSSSATAAQANAVFQELQNRARESGDAATLAEQDNHSFYWTLGSAVRTDAVGLLGVLSHEPSHALVMKLVRNLFGQRSNGRWRTTPENAFAIVALQEYISRFEAKSPDFTTQVWLGPNAIAEEEFAGRDAKFHDLQIPMSYLLEHLPSDLTISKSGRGRLYVRTALTFASDATKTPAVERGFSVARLFEAVDNKDDIRRDKQGVWHVRAGTRVRVRIQITTPKARDYVVVVDNLPAGFEPLDPHLLTTEALPPRAADERWRRYRWYWHDVLRSDRAEAYTPVLAAGDYEYSYFTRATTPGRFIAPAAKAEEMYADETFGRSAVDTIVIEP